jgi:hypothetical protein
MIRSLEKISGDKLKDEELRANILSSRKDYWELGT